LQRSHLGRRPRRIVHHHQRWWRHGDARGSSIRAENLLGGAMAARSCSRWTAAS
jgi:hypothetical protein